MSPFLAKCFNLVQFPVVFHVFLYSGNVPHITERQLFLRGHVTTHTCVLQIEKFLIPICHCFQKEGQSIQMKDLVTTKSKIYHHSRIFIGCCPGVNILPINCFSNFMSPTLKLVG